jgi:hypothetical protein
MSIPSGCLFVNVLMNAAQGIQRLILETLVICVCLLFICNDHVLAKCNSSTATFMWCNKLIIWQLEFRNQFIWFVWVFLESHEQFFSYLATVTITGDRAANLNLCLAITSIAFSSEGFFLHVRHGTSVFKVISERPVFLTSKCRDLDEGATSTYFKPS